MLTPQTLESSGRLLLKCRSGSHAYGLAVETSDEDFRGVFAPTRAEFFGGRYPAQVSDDTNDLIYYELGRFVELLTKANPTVLELLATRGDDVLHRHPVMDHLPLRPFLTKACKDTFAGYARSQIRKARGLNKKVFNPYPEVRAPLEDFCYVLHAGGSQPLKKWAAARGVALRQIGLANVDHARGVYAMYVDKANEGWAQGVSSGPRANAVSLTNVPKGTPCAGYLSFNQDGYTVYCRGHREYWDWVADRNQSRYAGTLRHGQGYDAKNMMHTLRLLDMAVEILRDGQLRVKRPNREFLLEVRAGRYPLEEVLAMAEDRLRLVDELAVTTPLPERVDPKQLETILIKMREILYGG